MRQGTVSHAILSALAEAGGSLDAEEARAISTWRGSNVTRLKEEGLVEVRFVLTEAGRMALSVTKERREARIKVSARKSPRKVGPLPPDNFEPCEPFGHRYPLATDADIEAIQRTEMVRIG